MNIFSSIHGASIFTARSHDKHYTRSSCNENLKSRSERHVTDDIPGEGFTVVEIEYEKKVHFISIFILVSTGVMCVLRGRKISDSKRAPLICYWRTNAVVKFNLFQHQRGERESGDSSVRWRIFRYRKKLFVDISPCSLLIWNFHDFVITISPPPRNPMKCRSSSALLSKCQRERELEST